MAQKEAKTSATDKKSTGNKPVISIRERGCVVSVFANPRRIEGKAINQYRLTFSRREKRGEEFVTKYSFRTEDLDRLVKMIRDAKEQIVEYDIDTVNRKLQIVFVYEAIEKSSEGGDQAITFKIRVRTSFEGSYAPPSSPNPATEGGN